MSEPDNAADAARANELGIESRRILDSLPDGITIQNREFTVIYQNRAMLEAFGDKRGMKCFAAYERRENQCEGCGIALAFKSGEPTLVLRTAFDAQGNTSYWENACFPIRDDDGTIVAAAEVCRNVSDRVGLEEEVKRRNIELGQLNSQLQKRTADLTETFQKLEKEVEQRERVDVELRHAQKLKAVGQLAAGIAHEINTPAQYVIDNLQFLADSFKDVQRLTAQYRQVIDVLTTVAGTETVAQTLAQQITQAEQAADLTFLQENIPSAVDHAREGLSQISNIVGAMKEFAHSDTPGKVEADLNRALRVALTVARNEYAAIAEVETDFGEIPLVTCNLGDMNQVFLNLLINAAQAILAVAGKSGKKGRIRVRTSSQEDMVRIDIADTGCGIPQSIRDSVFEPFFTTKQVGCGSGYGLAIARAIVVGKHGGSLTFQTEEGKGTTFTVQLPIGGSGNPTASPASSVLR